MQTLWRGVRPGPDLTRRPVQDGPIPILKARRPEAPQRVALHARAKIGTQRGSWARTRDQGTWTEPVKWAIATA
jgi:hypothetical protein